MLLVTGVRAQESNSVKNYRDTNVPIYLYPKSMFTSCKKRIVKVEGGKNC